MIFASLLAETSVSAIVSLLFFLALFIGIIVWLIVTGRTGRWSRDARMPLDDDRPVLPRTGASQEHRHG